MTISFVTKNNVNAVRINGRVVSDLTFSDQIEFDVFIESDGQFVGNIKGAKSVIVQGEMSGKIQANNNVLIDGVLEGDIEAAGLVYFTDNCSVHGDISYGSIVVAAGSKLLGLKIPSNNTDSQQNSIIDGLSHESKFHKHDGIKIPTKSTSEEMLNILNEKAIKISQQKLFSRVNHSTRSSNYWHLNARKLSILGFSFFKSGKSSIEIMRYSTLNNNIRTISVTYYSILIFIIVLGLTILTLYFLL